MTIALFYQDPLLRTHTSTVLAVLPLPEGQFVGQSGLILDSTIFYPLGGGQPGDRGTATTAAGEISLTDTRKGESLGHPGQIVHVLAAGSPLPAVGSTLTLTLDWAWRHANMRMHSALHLLSTLISGGVTGGNIAGAKGRLDFAVADAVPSAETLNAQLAALIAANHPISAEAIAEEVLDTNPQLVKTLRVAPPRGTGTIRLVRIGTTNHPIDLQPCGGTHVASTVEIGAVHVTKIENKGKENRRVSLALVTA